jgi:glucosyl-3-phosphoglycerate synthase
VRRSLFETLPVPVGYAVEIAALIDTLAARGLDAIAQVDLGLRGHRHQDLFDLGLMATQLLAAVARRQGGVSGEAVAIQQFLPSETGIERQTRDVGVRERPPAREVA